MNKCLQGIKDKLNNDIFMLGLSLSCWVVIKVPVSDCSVG